jgi:hypothetical protein
LILLLLVLELLLLAQHVSLRKPRQIAGIFLVFPGL